MAGDPDFQELQLIDTDRDGKASDGELQAHSSVGRLDTQMDLCSQSPANACRFKFWRREVSLRAGSADRHLAN
jgi:hypothetical protein